MLPYLTDQFGNASSQHSFGRRARAGLDEAHERVARAIGATPREIVFTSGGTEANNLAIKGAAWAGKARGHRILTTAVEHHSVGHTVRYLEKFGFEIVELPVDRYGRVDPDELEAAITPKTILVSVMWANNEVGTVQPIAELASRVHDHKGVLFHTDAVQAAPYLDIRLGALDVDLLTIAAHKFEGPKGVGVLYVRHGTNILAQQQGGPQERYRRAGTEDVASAIGLAVALELAVAERSEVGGRLRTLRDRLIGSLAAIEGLELTGHEVDRLPGHASFILSGHRGQRPDHGPRSGRPGFIDRIGVRQRVERSQPRPDGDGLSAGRGSRRVAPVARPDDHRDRHRRGGLPDPDDGRLSEGGGRTARGNADLRAVAGGPRTGCGAGSSGGAGTAGE